MAGKAHWRLLLSYLVEQVYYINMCFAPATAEVTEINQDLLTQHNQPFAGVAMEKQNYFRQA